MVALNLTNNFSANYHSLQWFKLVERIKLIVCEWLLFNAKWTIFRHHHGENKLYFNKMMTVLY